MVLSYVYEFVLKYADCNVQMEMSHVNSKKLNKRSLREKAKRDGREFLFQH